MNFKVRQKVLCVNDHYRTYCSYPLKKGLIYTIHGFYQCACGSSQVTLMEIPGVTNMGCRCNRTSVRRQSYFEWRFIPMEYFEIFIDLSSDKRETSKKIDEQVLELHKEVVNKFINAVDPNSKIVLCNKWLDYYSNLNYTLYKEEI